MKIPTEELQTAIYDRLTSGSNKIDWSVYDAVPENAQPPYIEIGEPSAVFDGAKSNPGTDNDVPFHLWSIKNSNKELDDMANAIIDSITISNDVTPNELTLSNYYVIYQGMGSFITMKDIDNRTRHGILIMNFLLQEK